MGTVNRMNLDGERTPAMVGEGAKLEELRKFTRFIVNEMGVDTCVFKGGLFLNVWTCRPRYTKDVDLDIADAEGYAKLVLIFKKYGEMLKANGTIASYEIVDCVGNDLSGGVKYRRADNTLFLSADVSYMPPSIDSIQMDVEGIGVVRINTIEQVMCDKLSALYSQKRFRRVKDLLDVNTILETCEVNLEKVVELMRAEGKYPLDPEQYPFSEENLVKYEHVYNKYKLHADNGEDILEKPDFYDVVLRIGRFLGRL